MIACVETAKGLCAVRWIGRKGLSVKALTYCGGEENAADGVMQVPDRVLTGTPTASVDRPGQLLKICEECKGQIA